jgi:hypothetical protein
MQREAAEFPCHLLFLLRLTLPEAGSHISAIRIRVLLQARAGAGEIHQSAAIDKDAAESDGINAAPTIAGTLFR